MINLYFNAEKQILTRTDREDLASSSREIHKCNFNLSNDWDDMQITAVFKYMGRKWDVLLADNACTVPAEVLEGQEGFTVGLYGTNGDQVITSTLITVPVSKGANASGGGNAQITPSMFDQIMAKIEEIEEGQIDPESIEAAIDEYLRENPDAVINSHEVYNAIIRSGLANLIPKYTYYTDGLEKTDAAAGVSYYVITPGHIGGYDTSDFGAIMVNVNGAAADSIYMIDGHTTLTPGKYQLAQAWSISDGISIVYSYIKDGTEIILAEVNSTNERVAFVLPEEVETEGYVTKLYIRVSQGTQYGSEILPILTYGDVTELSHIPHRYVMNNEELTEETELLKTAATNLSGSVNNLNGRVTELEEHGTGATPVISAAATVDNTTGTPAVNVTKTGTDAAPEFTFEFSGLKGPKGDPGTPGASYDDTEIRAEIDDVWKAQGELSAKNIFEYPYGINSATIQNVVFAANNDGSVSISGTTTTEAQYMPYTLTGKIFNIKPGTYKLTKGTNNNKIYITLMVRDSLNSWATIVDAHSDDAAKQTFTITEEVSRKIATAEYRAQIKICLKANSTANETIYPMIRFAADTDDTWQPYTYTNQELSDRVRQTEETLALLTPPDRSIVCWGDSLTAQGGWTEILQTRSGLTVYNAGTGGEGAQTIMTRQGGDIMEINNITIPATITPVTIATRAEGGINTQLGNKVTPLLQGGGAHVNPVTIGDITGTLAWTGSDYADQNGTWTFTRATAGEEVVINRPTAIRTNFDINHNGKNELMIIFMGQNGGWNDSADLIHQHKLMIDHFKGKEYVILGLSSGTAASRADYEAAMKEAFGRRFISLREYLAHPIYENGEIVSCYGLADQGLTPGSVEYNGVTYVALDEIAQGIVPHQILADSVHYTAGTKTVIGNMLYKKMQELNILA